MRRTALALSASLSLAACGGSSATRRAQSLYDQGDYQGAERSADADLTARPDDAGLHRVAIRARLAAGDAHGAVDAYAAWRHGDDDTATLRELAETTLAQAMRTPSPAIKVQAIEAVERLEIEALADDVIQRMGDQDDQVQAAAAVAVLHTHPQAPEILASMLTSEDPVARIIAVRGLGEKVGEHAAEDLRQAARTDPDPRVRITAIAGLAPLDDAATTDVLVQATRDPDDGVRTAALRALGRPGRGDRRAIGQAALADKDVGVRIAGAELLVASGDAAAIHALLAHPDPLVAIHAARAAAATDPAGAAAAIDRALADAAPETRAAALNLVESALGKPAALERAGRLLADASITVRLAAARAVAAAGARDRAIPVLLDALAAEPDDRIQAAGELARLDDPRGVSALDDLARTGDSVAHRRAAVSAHVEARHITPGLVAALADAAPEVRVDAAIALWSLARTTDLAAEHAP